MQVEHMWFNQCMKKREIYEAISQDRHIDQEEVKKHIKLFKQPTYTKVSELQTLFNEIKAESKNFPIIKQSNRYLKFDSLNGIISFSFSTNQIKNRYSDLVLFDMTTCVKYVDGFFISFFQGVDILGQQSILFTSIFPEKSDSVI